jgi:glutathione S-transferase/GST-like protein
VQKGIEMPPSKVDLTRDGEEQAKKFSEQARAMVEMGQSKKVGI